MPKEVEDVQLSVRGWIFISDRGKDAWRLRTMLPTMPQKLSLDVLNTLGQFRMENSEETNVPFHLIDCHMIKYNAVSGGKPEG